jgi:hypothetical protein
MDGLVVMAIDGNVWLLYPITIFVPRRRAATLRAEWAADR